MGRKNISRGKNRNLTDFSYLIEKPKDNDEGEDKAQEEENNKKKED